MITIFIYTVGIVLILRHGGVPTVIDGVTHPVYGYTAHTLVPGALEAFVGVLAHRAVLLGVVEHCEYVCFVRAVAIGWGCSGREGGREGGRDGG